MADAWPVELAGVTESVVTTRGPDGLWNVAALGLIADEPVRARTWGRTRTFKNFERTGRGYVQFVSDPVVFVDAALGILERPEPILQTADAWVEVEVERREADADPSAFVEWTLTPRRALTERRSVPTINRGFNAVVEATVAASRLDVEGTDRAALLERLDWLADVARRCGGDRVAEALERLDEHIEREPNRPG